MTSQKLQTLTRNRKQHHRTELNGRVTTIDHLCKWKVTRQLKGCYGQAKWKEVLESQDVISFRAYRISLIKNLLSLVLEIFNPKGQTLNPMI